MSRDEIYLINNSYIMMLIIYEKDVLSMATVFRLLGYPIASLRTIHGNRFGKVTFNDETNSYSIIPIINPTPIIDTFPNDMNTRRIVPLPDEESDRYNVSWTANDWVNMGSYDIIQATHIVKWIDIKWNPDNIPTELTIVYNSQERIDCCFYLTLYKAYAEANGYYSIRFPELGSTFIHKSVIPYDFTRCKKYMNSYGYMTRSFLIDDRQYELFIYI